MSAKTWLGAFCLLVSFGCMTGPQGPQGAPGANGNQGANGDAGLPGASASTCDGGSSTPLLNGRLTVSAPPNGSFFAAGQAPVITIQLYDNCGRPIAPSALGTANLYLAGPRGTLQTQTASRLLNCVVDRAATDRQHHFINLANPHFADATQNNLTQNADGTIAYRLAPVSTEAAGTYTAGVWAKTTGDVNQIFALVDFQIGTAAAENYASGSATANTCFDCHRGTMSGKSYQAHSFPSAFGPLGNFALDSAPVATCQLCHNTNGYSLNPIVRKVHGAHRGVNQTDAGVAHPDYGLGTDSTLAAFTNVTFPSLLGKEKDCAKCHIDDRWKNNPSRLACGTCHDNVFFSSGTLIPPRNFGRPATGACTTDANCSSFGEFATCDVPSGNCQRRMHPIQTGDQTCPVCHNPDAPGLSPISARHQIYERTAVRGLKIVNAALGGSSGPNGTFLIGDTPAVTFQLLDKNNNSVPDLLLPDGGTNPAVPGTAIIAGPSEDPQRLIGSLSLAPPGLTYDPVQARYTYVFPSALPVQALPPLNNPAPFNRPNPPGTYDLYLYVNENLTAQDGHSFRDYAGVVKNFKLGADQPIRARQVISDEACNSCHVETALHGTTRREPSACNNCHTQGAMDRGVGARGRTCSVDTDCPGFAGGWESCQSGTCVVTRDPTPNTSIRFSALVHAIHFARRREGYAERYNLVPGSTVYLGFQNTVVDLSDILLPQDIRNCTKCHTDSSATCTNTQGCGIGQECVNRACVNRAWLNPSGEVCLSCHDSAAATAHAAINTYNDPDGGTVESCEVCHGRNSDFAVDKMHQIANPYVPIYPRE